MRTLRTDTRRKEKERKKKSLWLWIGIGITLLLMLIGTIIFLVLHFLKDKDNNLTSPDNIYDSFMKQFPGLPITNGGNYCYMTTLLNLLWNTPLTEKCQKNDNFARGMMSNICEIFTTPSLETRALNRNNILNEMKLGVEFCNRNKDKEITVEIMEEGVDVEGIGDFRMIYIANQMNDVNIVRTRENEEENVGSAVLRKYTDIRFANNDLLYVNPKVKNWIKFIKIECDIPDNITCNENVIKKQIREQEYIAFTATGNLTIYIKPDNTVEIDKYLNINGLDEPQHDEAYWVASTFEDGDRYTMQFREFANREAIAIDFYEFICNDQYDAAIPAVKLFQKEEFTSFAENILMQQDLVAISRDGADVPENTDMTCWDPKPNPQSQYVMVDTESCQKNVPQRITLPTSDNTRKEYILKSLGIRIGRDGGGHWYTFLQHENQWIEVNDSQTNYIGDYEYIIKKLSENEDHVAKIAMFQQIQ